MSLNFRVCFGVLDALGSARHKHCVGVVLDHHTLHLLATSQDARCQVSVHSSARDAVIDSCEPIKYSMTHTVSGNERT